MHHAFLFRLDHPVVYVAGEMSLIYVHTGHTENLSFYLFLNCSELYVVKEYIFNHFVPVCPTIQVKQCICKPLPHLNILKVTIKRDCRQM